MNPAFFHAPISHYPLVCGSTDQAAHYHHLGFLTSGLHLLMTLGYSHTVLLIFSFMIMLSPQNIHDHFNELSFLHNPDEAPVTPQTRSVGLGSTEKDIALRKLIV
jgi:hypothetical protein